MLYTLQKKKKMVKDLSPKREVVIMGKLRYDSTEIFEITRDMWSDLLV